MIRFLLLTVLCFPASALAQDPSESYEGREPAAVEAVEEEGEFQVIAMESPAGPNSSLPSLVKGANRETYLSWVDREADKTAVLRIARLGANSWGAPIEVVRGKDLMLNWADFPSVQVSSSGIVIASWLRKGSEAHSYSAEFRISTDRCESWGPVTRLHDDDSPGEHGFVSLAPLGKDSFGAIWLDGRAMAGQGHGATMGHGAGAMALYFRTISKDGALGEEVVLDERVCDCCQTSLIALPDGGLLAAYRDRSGEEIRDIATLKFDGKQWSKPTPAHVDGWKIAGCPVNGPRLADGDSFRGVTWFTAAGKRGAAAYAKVGAGPLEKLRAIPIADKQTLGRVDMVPVLYDSMLVVWLEAVEDGQAEWRVRRISNAGEKGDSIVIAKVPGERSVGFLRMVSAGQGAVLAWTSPGPESRVLTTILRPREQ
ncbi:MAG: hypothetical protein ACI87O_001558 [Planctomycetota bacterium]|jgi:hypothetical protein